MVNSNLSNMRTAYSICSVKLLCGSWIVMLSSMYADISRPWPLKYATTGLSNLVSSLDAGPSPWGSEVNWKCLPFHWKWGYFLSSLQIHTEKKACLKSMDPKRQFGRIIWMTSWMVSILKCCFSICGVSFFKLIMTCSDPSLLTLVKRFE